MSGTAVGSLFSGKLALITGAGSGLGRAACKLLASQGASIVAVDKNIKSADDTLKSIISESKQLNHLSLDVDVQELSSVKSALKAVLEQYKKPPSIIVNAAGITRDNFLLKLSEADFKAVIDVNLTGTFFVVQTFVNSMIEHGVTNGSIINIASIIGKYGNIGQANYAASKAGVVLFTQTAAKEFGKFGIRANVILPGFIATPMLETVPDKIKKNFLSLVPLGRTGKPEEVAELIAFLASEKSSYVNGASIDITGGF